MNETICWTCRQGPRSGCPWFAEHRPVPGWMAVRKDVEAVRYNEKTRRNEIDHMEESYIVTACPLYQPDSKPEKRTGPYYKGPCLPGLLVPQNLYRESCNL